MAAHPRLCWMVYLGVGWVGNSTWVMGNRILGRMKTNWVSWAYDLYSNDYCMLMIHRELWMRAWGVVICWVRQRLEDWAERGTCESHWKLYCIHFLLKSVWTKASLHGLCFSVIFLETFRLKHSDADCWDWEVTVSLVRSGSSCGPNFHINFICTVIADPHNYEKIKCIFKMCLWCEIVSWTENIKMNARKEQDDCSHRKLTMWWMFVNLTAVDA